MDHRIITYIKSELVNEDVDHIEPHEDLVGAGLVDSLGMMRLIGFIEKQYGLRIGPEDMTVENFSTLQNIEAYIKSKRGTDAA